MASIHEAPRRHWRMTIGLVVALAVLGFLLLSEHRAHTLGALPYLLILLCPLMHLFMHGGHGEGPSGPKGGAS